mgnify:FL=1
MLFRSENVLEKVRANLDILTAEFPEVSSYPFSKGSSKGRGDKAKFRDTRELAKKKLNNLGQL